MIVKPEPDAADLQQPGRAVAQEIGAPVTSGRAIQDEQYQHTDVPEEKLGNKCSSAEQQREHYSRILVLRRNDKLECINKEDSCLLQQAAGCVDNGDMVRGWYTAASGMIAQQHRFDAIANNMANANTIGYKRDVSIHKAFPELLIRRLDDDGVRRIGLRTHSIGSVDTAPVVGRLGTGVEQNEVFTIFEQGSLRETSNPFDVALEGEGFLVVQTPFGERYTRNGSLILGPESLLVTKDGYPVLGEDGPIQIKLHNFVIDPEGRIFVNADLQDDPQRLVSQRENEWENRIELDQLRLIEVDRPRYLRKQGDSLWDVNEDSGPAVPVADDERPRIRQGFLETANVNPVVEMVRLIEVNRAYEANQRVVRAQDESTARLINQALRL